MLTFKNVGTVFILTGVSLLVTRKLAIHHFTK